VLVFGFCNSGGEIAVDLLEHGAPPTIAVRGVRQRWSRATPRAADRHAGTRLGHVVRARALADSIGKLVSRLAFCPIARLGVAPLS